MSKILAFIAKATYLKEVFTSRGAKPNCLILLSPRLDRSDLGSSSNGNVLEYSSDRP